MKKIAISSDSTLSIPQKVALENGFYVMPLNVIIDGREYHDDVDISKEELASFMRSGSRISTSMPTPIEIENHFNRIFDDGFDEIVHFTISSKLSSMFSLFTVTSKELYGDKVIIIDSLSVCSFMANHVKQAVIFRDAGLSAQQIASKVNERINSENAIFIPETLTNGEIGKKGTTRHLKKTLEETMLEYKKGSYNHQEYEIDILQFDPSDATLELVKNIVKKHFPNYDIHIQPIALNVCAHAGPGTIGVGFNLKPQSN